MNSEHILTLKNMLSVVSVILGLKLLKWLFTYIYQVWVYNHINGPPIIPFFGNFLSLNSSKSGLDSVLNFKYFKT